MPAKKRPETSPSTKASSSVAARAPARKPSAPPKGKPSASAKSSPKSSPKSTAKKATAAKRAPAKAPPAKGVTKTSKLKATTMAKRSITRPRMVPPPRETRAVLEAPRDREPRLVESATMMQAFAMATRTQGRTIGFVPTMGALHAGHAALLREARQRADILVVSIFVNPLQFGQSEDLSRYPRPLDADRALCRSEGVDIIFAPSVQEMYPEGFQTQVRPGSLASSMEGAVRAGHFDGVLTVVSLLFQIVRPHFAVFGEKDYQQLSLVRRMVRDLRVPVEIIPMPVIRDVDGLALSSRNAYLSTDERKRATTLYRALMAAQDVAQSGELSTAKFIEAARAVLDATEGFTTDYVDVRDPMTLEPVAELTKTARLLLAGRLGPVRLLDNGPLFAGVRRAT